MTEGQTDDARQEMMARVARLGFEHGDAAAHDAIAEAAASAARLNQHVVSGYLWELASRASWGDLDRMLADIAAAKAHYQTALDTAAECTADEFVSRYRLAALYLHAVFDRSDRSVRLAHQSVLSELSQRLVTCFASHPDKEGWLVRGVIARLQLSTGGIAIEFPNHEVLPWTIRTSGDLVSFELTSAFSLMCYLDDWAGAVEVAGLCPSGFKEPSTLGWREAARGFTEPGTAAEHFAAAASHFSQDTPDRMESEGLKHWDGINSQVWAPYFAARSKVAQGPGSEVRLRDLIAEAANILKLEDINRMVPNVRRFAVLLEALDRLLSPEAGISIQDVRGRFLEDSRLATSDDDQLIGDFLETASRAFEGFVADPVNEIGNGQLHAAIDVLSRIRVFGRSESSAIGPALRQSALEIVKGIDRTWMHRNLAGIDDEAVLRQLLLRLLQAELPAYAQIVHGPIEYGRDVISVIRDRQGRVLLKMYQVKAGDIDSAAFEGIRYQLEKMFIVPLSDFQLSLIGEPQRVGILICNGHAGPHVTPVMQGWFEAQRADHGWDISFMHIDDWVKWIVERNLVSTFRRALMDLGVYQR